MRSSKSSARLLVEGIDDKHSVIHLLARHGFDFDDGAKRPVDVDDYGGIDKLLQGVVTATSTYPRVGVIIDADHPPFDRWAQLGGGLMRAGEERGYEPIRLPDVPAPGGTIVPGRNVDWKFGVWVMPDNVQRGMLEDFLAALVPADDVCWPLAVQSTRRARELGAPLKLLHESKGAMHAWLAWQDPSGQPFGTALRSKALRHDTAVALAFLDWFKRLFDVTPHAAPG